MCLEFKPTLLTSCKKCVPEIFINYLFPHNVRLTACKCMSPNGMKPESEFPPSLAQRKHKVRSIQWANNLAKNPFSAYLIFL